MALQGAEAQPLALQGLSRYVVNRGREVPAAAVLLTTVTLKQRLVAQVVPWSLFAPVDRTQSASHVIRVAWPQNPLISVSTDCYREPTGFLKSFRVARTR